MSDWKVLHTTYKTEEWIDKPSIFAETALHYFPKSGKILELGAGLGQDSLFFADNGYEVVSTDINIEGLTSHVCKQAKPENIHILALDLKKTFPFADQSFEIVYAHLSLHYFDHNTTSEIFKEIRRVLKPKGVFAFLANSVNDPEYLTGSLLEHDYFLVDLVAKRYFSIDATKKMTEDFEVILLDNKGQTYKDQAKGVSSLIRFIGNKPLFCPIST